MGYTPKVERIITLTVPGILAVGSTGIRWYNRTSSSINLTGVAISVGQQPSGAAIIVDVNIDNVTAFSDQSVRPQIPDGAFSSSRVTPGNRVLAIGSFISIDLDQIGSTGAGADLVVQVMF